MLIPALQLLTRPVEGADLLISAAALSAGLSYGECVPRLDPELDPITDFRTYSAIFSGDVELSTKGMKTLFDDVEIAAKKCVFIPSGVTIQSRTGEWKRHADQNADATVLAQMAIQVERLLMDTSVTFETDLALARLVAALTDRAAFLARQAAYRGFCSELSDIEWDIRHLATSLVRIGSLPKRDPRVLLDDAKYREYADINVGAELSRLILDAQRQVKEARAHLIAGRPYRL